MTADSTRYVAHSRVLPPARRFLNTEGSLSLDAFHDALALVMESAASDTRMKRAKSTSKLTYEIRDAGAFGIDGAYSATRLSVFRASVGRSVGKRLSDGTLRLRKSFTKGAGAFPAQSTTEQGEVKIDCASASADSSG